MPEGWEWDESLFAGSAPHYRRGRPPYAPGLVDAIVAALRPDGGDPPESGWVGGRLLDVGCGPGTVALPLAGRFDEVIGLDPDAGMLAEAARQAAAEGITNARWVLARAEALPAALPEALPEALPGGIGPLRAVTFAQSFHWMDRDRVAAAVRGMLEPDGVLFHISDEKNPAPRPPDESPADPLPFPRPPYAAIEALVRAELGPVRRAGRGTLPAGSPGREDLVFARNGFRGPERITVPATAPLVRDSDELVSWVFSLSGSAPHLFGDRLGEVEAGLRRLLADASPAGRFADPPLGTDLQVWRPI